MRLCIALIILSIGCANAQVIGKQFPQLSAETANNKKVKLPADTKGKYTIIGLSYSKKSEDELSSWFGAIYTTFIQESDGGIFSVSYDVNTYFVLMFIGANSAAIGTAKKQTLRNLDPELVPHLLFYKGEFKPYKDALQFEANDVPYFYVLDMEGNIVHVTSGAYSDEKLAKMEEAIE